MQDMAKTKQKGGRNMEDMARTVHRRRELTQDEMKRFLGKHLHGRLGLCVEGEPYVVPVAYRYSEGAIYFHTGKGGKKVDFMRKNNRVCFEVDEWQKAWASVVCYGRVTLQDDLEAKRRGFELLTGQSLPEDRISSAPVYIGTINIEEMTGRCSADFQFS
jgi:nitroimidazol reductase NimA-like FMN-containing flavoprotein (pyridoxamine 5'-phosphate oxidase superfamily)